MNSKFLFLTFSLISLSFSAVAAELCGKVAQGHIVLGKVAANEEVFLNGHKLLTTNDGKFLLAFSRDETNTQELKITTSGLGSESAYRFAVAKTEWDIQNIKGIPPRKVTPSDADLEAIELERKLTRASLKEVTESNAWQSGFILPVDGRISGKFGGQRIMNNVPKNPHQGMDIATKEGTPVKASGDGQVVLAYPDLFYSGNMVVIDHGFGLQTIYAHLKDINVKRGDMVKKGDVIGSVGKTGRVTGPHLHWGASLRNVRFNPAVLIDINTEKQNCFTL